MDALLVDALRTPRGKARANGALHSYRPVELVEVLIEAMRARVGELEVDDLLLGCVTQIGDQGTNVARLAALWAGLDVGVPGVTLNRFCTSGLDAIGLAAGKLAAGDRAVLAGGVEMPSRAPMFGDEGAWISDAEVSKRTGFVHMGVSADLLATDHGIEREELDAWALRSQRRAARAEQDEHFTRRVAVGDVRVDETPRPETTLESLAEMAAAYGAMPGPARESRHTVATSPALADGASLSLLATAKTVSERGWTARARLRGYASVAVDPQRMLHGNPLAAREALRRASLSAEDVDLWEVNESFAVVPVLFGREMEIAPDVLNVVGGAIALGHPLGATGGVLTATLLESMERMDAALGVVSICGGAGVATALVWERL